MVTRERFLPTRPSKARCIFLIGAVIFLYSLENSFVTSYISGRIFNYNIKPILWLGLAYVVYLLPKVRANGKLKLRGFINWWAFNFAIIYIIIVPDLSHHL